MITLWICQACGRLSKTRDAFTDTSCMTWAVELPRWQALHIALKYEAQREARASVVVAQRRAEIQGALSPAGEKGREPGNKAHEPDVLPAAGVGKIEDETD